MHGWHRDQGAKLVEFAGWSMPVQYSGLLDEHRTVRSAAGLFDVSHMGEITVAGPGALAGVNRLVSNDCARLAPGQILYTVACAEDGGVLDDLLVYRLAEEAFLLVVNASNTGKMAAWTKARLGGELDVRDGSAEISQIAVQGPRSLEILCACPLFRSQAERIRGLPFYEFFTWTLSGKEILISRTGYTGELGFEIYLPNELAVETAEALMAAGKDQGIKPAGLGARDTLRLEASYCLYGNELDEQTDPYEAGLFWLVKADKGDFIGRDALLRRKDAPGARRLLGFELPDRKIARHGYAILSEGSAVGHVTSGTFSPSLSRSLGMALVRRDRKDAPLAVDIRGDQVPCRIVKLPFYSQPALRA